MSNPSKSGQVLKQARESRGITLEAVQDATKIPLDALKAIEEGYTVRSLSPFYYKGFLKMYGECLQLDIPQIIEDYKTERLKETFTSSPTIKKNIDIELPNQAKSFFTKRRQQQIVIAVGGLLALLLFGKMIGAI